MNLAYPIRFVARVTIEFDTALHVGMGDGDDLVDAAIITDANGLAAIPGDSLAGVLRTAWRARQGNDQGQVNDLFGGRMPDGHFRGSRLLVSWGHIHDAEDRPVVGIIDTGRLRDEVLQSALTPERRDHVRLGHRGVAQERGLFSEHYLCAGHRFTFELELIGQERERNTVWQPLLGLLNSAAMRLGGKTRRGWGAFQVTALRHKAFDLRFDRRKDREFKAYAALPADLSLPAPLSDPQPGAVTHPADALVVDIPLTPAGYWLFGGGSDDPEAAGGEADLTPVLTPRVIWEGGRGRIEQCPYLPGSGIKGAMAHRVAFHYNALAGNFADDLAAVCQNTRDDLKEKKADTLLTPYAGPEQNPAVRELFGMAKEGRTAAENSGQRGRVIIDDLLVPQRPQSQLVAHAPLDRFSGGTLNLFNERPFWQGAIPPLRVVVLDQGAITDRRIRLALQQTILDLAEGRLSLGSGSGRGLGFFTINDGADPAWSKGLETWANEKEEAR